MAKFDFIFKNKNSTHLIEKAIYILLKNGVHSVDIKNTHKATLFSLLYPFSVERVAEAIANLCNNEIITVNYETKEASFTPLFQHFVQVLLNDDNKLAEKIQSGDSYFVKNIAFTDNMIVEFKSKIQLMQQLDSRIDFKPILNYVDIKVIE